MILEPGYLSPQAIFDLAPNIREADRRECKDGDAFKALLSGHRLNPAGAYTAIRPDRPRTLGAFGWTTHGVIWSLWTDLTRSEARAVLRHTPLWVAQMVKDSGVTYLENWVHCDNDKAIGWLHASGCFSIDHHPTHVEGQPPMYHFRTALDV